METFIGCTGLVFLGLFLLISYMVRPIKEEDDIEELFSDESGDMCLTSELDDEISEIARSLDNYLLERCLSRAKNFGRKTADISDLRCVMFELEFDNKVLTEIKK